jgi:hypothetical protein
MILRLMAVIAFTAPAWLRAQGTPDSVAVPAAPPPAVFAYVQYGDTIGYEAVTSDTAFVRGVFLVPGQGRIAWDHALVAQTPTTLVLSVFPGDYAGVVPVRETAYERHGDSMVVTARVYDQTERDTVATNPGALPAFGRSMTHLAFLAFHAVQSRRASLPLFLVSSGKTVMAVVEVRGEVVTLTVEGLRIETLWTEDALSAVRVPSQGLVVQRVPGVPAPPGN